MEETYIVDVFDDEVNEAMNRIHTKMAVEIEPYFTLLRDRALEGEFSEPSAVAFGRLSVFVDTKREEILRLGKAILDGELRDDLGKEDAALLQETVASVFERLGGEEEARDLLHLVMHENTSVSLTALRAIAKIANPSIIPALRVAVEDRIQESYLENQIIGAILERHPPEEEQREPSAPGAEEEPVVEETPTAESGTRGASERDSDSAAAEESRGGWGLWALGGALVLGAAVYALVRGRSAG